MLSILLLIFLLITSVHCCVWIWICLPRWSYGERNSNKRSIHLRTVSRYIKSFVKEESVANSNKEDPIPARLDTGVSYLYEYDENINILVVEHLYVS